VIARGIGKYKKTGMKGRYRKLFAYNPLRNKFTNERKTENRKSKE
jgi:hypothetical protein